MIVWKINAKSAEKNYGSFVDWEEKFYNCPECGEPVYECDWEDKELMYEFCPICGFKENPDDRDRNLVNLIFQEKEE